MLIQLARFIVSILIFLSFSMKVEEMTPQRSKLVFASQRIENVDPDVVIKSFWVSSALALILTLPSLGIFLGFYYNAGSLILGAVIGFGLHFVLLALSEKITNLLSKLFDD
jgi:hypothetical protein